jgi:transposase
MWLIRKLASDFKKIADFGKCNVGAVKSSFHELTLFLKDQGLFKSHDIAVDGTKIIAINSMERSYSKQRLKKTMDDLDNKIDKYLREMDENDEIEESIDKQKIGKVLWTRLRSDNKSMEKHLYSGRVKGVGVFNPLLIPEATLW